VINGFDQNINDEDEESESSSDSEEEETFFIERARSGRSTCRGCWTAIPYNELRFGVTTPASDWQHYESTRYYHTRCFGNDFRNNRRAQQSRNIGNHVGFSRPRLERFMRSLFGGGSDNDSNSSSSSSSSSSSNSSSSSSSSSSNASSGVSGAAPVAVVPRIPDVSHVARVPAAPVQRRISRVTSIDGIDFRARVHSLQRLTMRQMKRYTTVNGVHVPSSIGKHALVQLVQRDILQYVQNEHARR